MTDVMTREIVSIEDVVFSAPAVSDGNFHVDSLDKAAWAGRKILQAEERMNRRSHLAEEYKRKIDDWLAEANKEDLSSVSYLSSVLEPFAVSEIAQQPRSRSLKLPGVTLGLRSLPARMTVLDEQEALAYCEAHHPEALIVRKDLSKIELKRLYLAGTPIPGVVLDGGGEKLYVKAS